MKTCIQVKEEHIKNGQPENCENCALALAVKDSLKADSVSVTTDCDENIEISAWFDKLGYRKQKDIIIVDSDQIQVNHFVEAFDSFGAVGHDKKGLKPFEFDIELNNIF